MNTGEEQPTHPTPMWSALLLLTPQLYSTPHLSAMCSCLASSASLLKVFHMASVSGVIFRVSKKAVALEMEGAKAQGMNPGSGRHGGTLVMDGAGQGGPGISCLDRASFTTCPQLLVTGPAPSSPGVVAIINGCSKLNEALIQCVGNCSHTFGHHHLGLSPFPLQAYNVTL